MSGGDRRYGVVTGGVLVVDATLNVATCMTQAGGAAQRCGGAVGAGRGDEPVFGDVGVGGGDDAGGEVRSRRRETAAGDAGPEDQRVRRRWW